MSKRTLLSLGIFINLMIDGCACIHEIVPSEVHPKQCLRWKVIQLCVFRRSPSDAVTIAGLVRFNHLKGMRDDPKKCKNISLMALPTSMWFEDSLRLIIFSALIDGHIDGAQTWPEFEKLANRCMTSEGMLIPFHESSQDLPLIPAIDHTLGTVVRKEPIKPDQIPWHLKRLGRLCGFKDLLVR